MDLGGVILCGGRSSRMGRPKAWLSFGKERLLQRVVRIVAEIAEPVVVVAAADQPLPPLPPGVTVARDPIEGRGPLLGIATGLAHLAPAVGYAFVGTTDAPFVTSAFVQRMRALAGGHEAAVVRDGGHAHPVQAVYATRAHREAEALLAAGRARASGLAEVLRTRFVSRAELLTDPALAAADPALRALDALNTPDDYARALAALDRGPPDR